MERYIGIDSHDESCTIVVLGPTGKVIQKRVVETKARALVDAIKEVGRRRNLCLEEGPLSEWLYELLEPHVDEIEVVQAPQNSGNKSDGRDAHWLADAMRTNARRTLVFKKTTTARGLREAVRGYQTTVRELTRSKNRLNALMRSRGIRVDDTLYDDSVRSTWIAKLPNAFRTRAQLYGEMIDAAARAHAAAAEVLTEQAGKSPEVKRIRTAPGIGEIRAATIVAIVVTPNRFRTARQFWAYCGMGIVMHGTSQWSKDGNSWKFRRETTQTRGLNHNRNPHLKAVFKGAAKTVVTLMSEHPLTKHYRALVAAKTEPHLALLTIARRIAAAVLSMWKNKEEYDPTKQLPKKAA